MAVPSVAFPFICPSPFRTIVTRYLDTASLRDEKRSHMGRQPGIVLVRKADDIGPT